MELPKISVIIPSYNKVKFIRVTLESIFTQKYQNIEIIIQDGGSTDGTLQIIKKYAKKYPKKITWESKKDKGQVDAINKGLRKATGDILTFINADDVYSSTTFEKVGKYFAKKPETQWLAGFGRVIDINGREISKEVTSYKNFLLKLNRFPLLLSVNYLTQPSVFFSKVAYSKYGPFVGTTGYVLEYALWLKLAKDKMPDILGRTLSSFRISADNISSVSYSKVLADDYKLAKIYTGNPLILLIHKLNNWGRVVIINLIK